MTHEPNPKRFDPYHKWLGIAPADQPPNHYRLLGVDVFEADLEVIESAADRQMSYIQQCAAGDHLEQSQAILNELAAARVALLNPKSKDAYDAQLRNARQPETRFIHAAPATPRHRTRSRSLLAVFGFCIVAAVGGLLVWQFAGRSDDEETVESEHIASSNRSRKSGNPDDLASGRKSAVVAAKSTGTVATKTLDPNPTSQKIGTKSTAKSPKIDAGAPRTIYQLAAIALKVTQRRQAEDDFVTGVNAYVSSQDRDDRVRAFQKLAKAHPNDEDLFLLARETVLVSRIDSAVAKVSLNYCLSHFSDRPECLELARQAAAGNTPSEVQSTSMKFLIEHSAADDPKTANIAKQVLRSKAHPSTQELAIAYLLASFASDPELPELALLYGKLESTGRALPALQFLVANDAKNPAVVALMDKHAQDPNAHRHIKALAVEFMSTLSIGTTSIKSPTTLIKSATRGEVPHQDDVRAASAEIRGVIADDIKAAKTAAAKIALANRLVSKSNTESISATRYAFLMVAHDLAIETGNATQVLSIIEKLNAAFQIDATARKLASLQSVGKSIKSREVLRSFLGLLAEEYRNAVDIDRFDVAESLLETATTAARKLRDTNWSRLLVTTRAELKELRQEFAEYQRALSTLENVPRDPEALMNVAKFVCLRKDSWDAGLKRLANIDDAALLDLLVRNSAGATETVSQVKLADDWWTWIRADRRKTRDWLRPIPASWYANALTKVNGLERTRLEKRLQEIGSVVDARIASTQGVIRANRRAAEWALRLDGQVRIRIAQSEIDIAILNELPPVPFLVVSVSTNYKPIGDIDLVNLTGLTELRTLDLTDSLITGDGLSHLRQSKKLESLVLQNSGKCTSQAMPYVAMFRELKHLNLSATATKGRGLEHLAGLTKLESLNLLGVPLSSKSVVHLANLDRLQELVLSRTGIDSRGIRSLNKLLRLERLDLNSVEIVDMDLQIVGTFVGLRDLSIGGSENLSDQGLSYLKSLPALERLDLSESRFTDQGLMQLTGLKMLKEIEATNSQITDAGIERFRQLQAGQ